MSCLFRRQNLALTIMLLLATLLAACSSLSISGTTDMSRPGKPAQSNAIVTIPSGQDLFEPFIVAVRPGTMVIWQNQDKVAHNIMTTWDHSSFLNPEPFALTAAPGKQAAFTFTTPGIYDYFDSSQARWDTTDHRVAAHNNGPNFPLAMEGVIWVQGAIKGLPATASNVIPNGKDEFRTDFIAIARNGAVSWHNGDTDTHFISLVQGWPVPINSNPFGAIEIKGVQAAPPHGGTSVVRFHTAGLYYYYCSAHATINTTWHRAQAQRSASEYPIPMEGFILVGGE
jgi:plastocyanin